MTSVVVLPEGIHIRAARSTAADSITTALRGQRLEIVDGPDAGWLRVRLQGLDKPATGWCLSRYVDTSLHEPMPVFPAALDTMWTLASKYNNRVGYELGAKALGLSKNPPTIDCSGWIAFLLLQAMPAQNKADNETVFSQDDIDVLNTYSDRMIVEVEISRPSELIGPQITSASLRPGMIIGLNTGRESWESNAFRAHGINHVVALVRRPSDGAVMVSESCGPPGSGGVRLKPLASFLSQYAGLIRAGSAWAVDPLSLADPFSAFVQRSRGISVTGPSALLAVSAAAQSMIIGFEVTDEAYYNARWRKPTWPGLNSGVTVGIGYDLGQTEPGRIARDWGSMVNDATLKWLVGCAEIKGGSARALAESAPGAIDIAWESACKVFGNSTLPDVAISVRRSLPNTEDLPSDSFGALISLVMNRGASFSADGDRYAEMRGIKDAMVAKTFAKIPDLIRDMKRLWPGTRGLQDRRDQEAALFERGLSAAAIV
jgi:hypothetical protein